MLGIYFRLAHTAQRSMNLRLLAPPYFCNTSPSVDYWFPWAYSFVAAALAKTELVPVAHTSLTEPPNYENNVFYQR